jgi:hypothetical protein
MLAAFYVHVLLKLPTISRLSFGTLRTGLYENVNSKNKQALKRQFINALRPEGMTHI